MEEIMTHLDLHESLEHLRKFFSEVFSLGLIRKADKAPLDFWRPCVSSILGAYFNPAFSTVPHFTPIRNPRGSLTHHFDTLASSRPSRGGPGCGTISLALPKPFP
jgi:hypothetical protein